MKPKLLVSINILFIILFLNCQPVIKTTTSPTNDPFVSLINEALESVVMIKIVSTDGFIDEILTVGSGFVITNNGYIVTNYHVVDELEDGSAIFVQFKDGRQYKLEAIYLYKKEDIAFLKINAKKTKQLKISKTPVVQGQKVIALGSAGRLIPFSFFEGRIISDPYYKNDIKFEKPWIRTDCIVYPGFSGGPVIDTNGNVVGINNSFSKNYPHMSLMLSSSLIVELLKDVREKIRNEKNNI